jgi:hypothetical protein
MSSIIFPADSAHARPSRSANGTAHDPTLLPFPGGADSELARDDFRLRRSGRWLSYAGLATILLSVSLGLVAALYPHRWHIGSLVVSLRSAGRPIGFFLTGFGAWYFSVDRRRKSYQFFRRWFAGLDGQFRALGGQLLAAWQRWDWRGRLFLLITGANLVLMLIHASHYPQIWRQDRENRRRAVANAECELAGRKVPSLEHFAKLVVEQTPPDARILFEGRTAGMRLAFEVYPRRVFMLPQDYRTMATQWHVQPWLKNPVVDPHEAYWHQFLPAVNVPAEDFVRDRSITYVAHFDELNLSECKLERLQ